MNGVSLKRFTLLLGLVFLVASLGQLAEARLSVDPLTLQLEASSGESASGNLNLRNTGQETMEVNVQLVDWQRSPTGGLQFLPPGANERSCADWLLYSPTSLTLEPGERRQVSVEVNVPPEAEGDHWAMFLVTEEAGATEDEQPLAARFTVNYAIKILQRDPDAGEKSAEITGMELSEVDPLQLSVTYANTGSSHLMTTGTVEIRDLEGETVRESEINEFPTLPGEQRTTTVELSEEQEEPLKPGTYFAIVVMDYGGERLIQGGLPIEIPEQNEEESTAD